MTAQEFKKIRLFLGETQEQFRVRLDYETVASISRKENGKSRITKKDIRKLKEFLTQIPQAV